MQLPFRRAVVLFLLVAALPSVRAQDHEKLCADLAQTEQKFCAQVATLGLDDAFLANLADECFLPYYLSLTRSEYEAQVKEARAKAASPYKPGPNPDLELVWVPSKVDVSADGTLGYTWGRYDLKSRGKDGKVDAQTGVYLTIWKREMGGAWKIAFDGSPQLPPDSAPLKAFMSKLKAPLPPHS